MKTIDRVLKQLNEDSRTRDNDELLCAKIWHDEFKENIDLWWNEQKQLPSFSAIEFLRAYSERKFTSAESIRRCRQKLQEEYAGLRGASYNQRQHISQAYKKIFTNEK